MNTDFNGLTNLRNLWKSLQPLTQENETRLWRKLRLEWNYHSNHIEGNTLTYGETELLLIHDQTNGHHEHREYLEMKAHDLGIKYAQDLSSNSTRLLTEGDIRDLNKIILKEPFWKAAETPDGKPSRKEIIPGQYKTTPNNVRTSTGEIFTFTSVEETPPKMQELVDWLRQELTSPTLHHVSLASQLHHRFVLIHPFDDGNGRVARLLVNYVLMRSGYLPVIVRTEDKVKYLQALRLADAGDITALTDYLGELAEWSLQIGIKAAKGESIEESTDLDKEIALFIRHQTEEKRAVIPFSPKAIVELYELGWFDLFERFEKKIKLLSKLFTNTIFNYNIGSIRLNSPNYPIKEIAGRLSVNQTIEHYFVLKGYAGHAKTPFDIDGRLQIQLREFGYQIFIVIAGSCTALDNKLYSEPILSDEAEELTSNFQRQVFERIKAAAQ